MKCAYYNYTCIAIMNNEIYVYCNHVKTTCTANGNPAKSIMSLPFTQVDHVLGTEELFLPIKNCLRTSKRLRCECCPMGIKDLWKTFKKLPKLIINLLFTILNHILLWGEEDSDLTCEEQVCGICGSYVCTYV